ncbi:IS1634 family transposase [bacterium]|nr:IS1634 family transposase [candidate division CSSED10-310 bacterium]
MVEQKIGKQIYLYRAESYWDPEKKQSRQRRVYLGKKDPDTGAVIKPREKPRPRSSRDFGALWLLRQIDQQLGLLALLESVFGAAGRDLFNLALFEVCESRPAYLYGHWVETAYLPGVGATSSPAVSEIAAQVGRNDRGREAFFEQWARHQSACEAVVFDISSLSSYGELLDLLEWGYNRDHESLPQINFGVVMAQPSGVPLFYRVYPGSIHDVSTLRNIVHSVTSLGVSSSLLVLDRGFYSQDNLTAMAGAALRFVIPMPFTTKLSLQVLAAAHKQLSSPLAGFAFRQRTMFHLRRPVTINQVACTAHVYLEERRRAAEIEALIQRLQQIESFIAQGIYYRVRDVAAAIRGQLRGYEKFYAIQVRDGKASLSRKAKALSLRINRMGKSIILTNDEALHRDYVLDIYRRKDKVEKIFDTLKNELDAKRLRGHSREVVEGRLFISFIALILYSRLLFVLNQSTLKKTYSVPSLLAELKKLRTIEMSNGTVLLTELSKKQRDIFKAFGFPPPEQPSY